MEKEKYQKEIQKRFLELNERQSELIELRKLYANNYQVTNGNLKSNYKNLLDNVDQERKQNRNEAKYLRKVRENLEKANIFNRDDILNVMSYIVSVIENEEYQVFKYYLQFLFEKNEAISIQYFHTFLYLAPINSYENSLKELSKKYSKGLKAKDLSISDLFNGDNYTGICLYKNGDSSDIIFSQEPINVVNTQNQKSFGYINENRFNYLNEFIKKVIDYKAYMECEFGYPIDSNLTYEELYNLANDFIAEYNKKKVK